MTDIVSAGSDCGRSCGKLFRTENRKDRELTFSFLSAGECCVTVSFGNEVSLEKNTEVRSLYRNLLEYPVDGMVEAVPTYCALSVHFRPEVIRRKTLEKVLSERIEAMCLLTDQGKKEKLVPVLYGGEAGPDLEDCAKREGITAAELIRRHTEHPYYVFQLGFSPGHPYMARFEEPFSFQRRETPRTQIPAHSVVAQTNLTNITPFSQACGWNILGSTPLNITDYYREKPFFFEAGDRVRLVPVDEKEYRKILKENQPMPVPQIRVPEGKGIFVEQAGALTTVQDGGRFGHQAEGISPAGPMDHRAFHLANLLVGNRRGEAALELTLTGPELLFYEDTCIAVTGADLGMTLNGCDVPSYTAVPVRAGDRLTFGTGKNGCRAYLAVAGGIAVPEVLGSRSTDLKNRLGGFEGRALRRGDRIPVGACERPFRARSLPKPHYEEKELVLRVVRGPQDDRFTRRAIRSFFNYGAVITDRSDRQGIRLEREPLEFVTDGNIISDGISMGAVQVPSDGKPIILLADRQSVGGYTKIGTVIYADLPQLAQAKTGCRVRFVEVSAELAEELYLREQKQLDELEGSYGMH